MRYVSVDAIFANREVRLSELDVYGFDYDYTLVNYTSELADFIFGAAIDLLISRWKVVRFMNYNFQTIVPN